MTLILANFGGPRSMEEIFEFLTALLTDEDVLQLPLPSFLAQWLCARVAARRAKSIGREYALMGGKSPIFATTEAVAEQLRQSLSIPVISFHRYLPKTHNDFLQRVEESSSKEFLVLPLYPQFSYTTTGSTARFFEQRVKKVSQFRWIRSYANHPVYIEVMQKVIEEYLRSQCLVPEEVFLFFSAHGLPQKYVDRGDPYQRECRTSFEAICSAFPRTPSLLAFQSKFGPGKWLKPYTSQLCESPRAWNQGKEHIVFVPLSFTSDHIETIVEMEHQYLPPIRKAGLHSYRCPALNTRFDFVQALCAITQEPYLFSNESLIRS